MTHFVCFAKGQADFLPDDVSYHEFETVEGLLYAVQQEIETFDREEADASFWGAENRADNSSAGRLPYHYAFRAPNDGENNYSQRVCISRFTDRVLDVIGMTAEDYARESGE